jgi:ribosome recycling factor
MNTFLKEIQENTIKLIKEINKTFETLKMEIDAIKKTQNDEILEIENQGKKTGTKEASITDRIQKEKSQV